VAKVREEMEALEEEMAELKRPQARQRGEEPPPSRRRGGGRGRGDDDDSDDDEFFDRVSAQKKKNAREKGGQSRKKKKKASLPELRERKAELEAQQADLRRELALATVEVEADGQSSSSSSSATAVVLDPLDAFMIGNRAVGKVQRKATAEAKLQTLAAELAEIENTLGFAQPAYLSLRTEAVDATKVEATQPKPVSAAAAALGTDLVASAREHTEKPQTEQHEKQEQEQEQEQEQDQEKLQRQQMKREVSASRQPAPGSMAAAIAQAKASENSEPPRVEAGSSSLRGDTAAATSPTASLRKHNHSNTSGEGSRKGAGDGRPSGLAAKNSTASSTMIMPERVSTKDLISQIAAAQAQEEGQGMPHAAHTGSGGLGSQPTLSGDSAPKLKSAAATGASTAAKRGRMIDGRTGGLQVMSKKQRKTDAPQFGRGVSQVRSSQTLTISHSPMHACHS
jgi:hypothetical protein